MTWQATSTSGVLVYSPGPGKNQLQSVEPGTARNGGARVLDHLRRADQCSVKRFGGLRVG